MLFPISIYNSHGLYREGINLLNSQLYMSPEVVTAMKKCCLVGLPGPGEELGLSTLEGVPIFCKQHKAYKVQVMVLPSRP